jgi:hypothetical protein
MMNQSFSVVFYLKQKYGIYKQIISESFRKDESQEKLLKTCAVCDKQRNLLPAKLTKKIFQKLKCICEDTEDLDG